MERTCGTRREVAQEDFPRALGCLHALQDLASRWEPCTFSAPSSRRRRPGLAQRPQDLNKTKSLVSRAGGQAPSSGIRSPSGGRAQGAQEVPAGFDVGGPAAALTVRCVATPLAFVRHAFPSVARRQYTCTAGIYNALLRDGIDLGRVKYKHKLIKHCIMEPYRNAGGKQINTSAAGAAILPLPQSNRLVTSNYKPRKRSHCCC